MLSSRHLDILSYTFKTAISMFWIFIQKSSEHIFLKLPGRISKNKCIGYKGKVHKKGWWDVVSLEFNHCFFVASFNVEVLLKSEVK